MRHSIEHRDRIFDNSYGFLSFAKNMGKNIGENAIKTLATDALKTESKKAIQKIEEATGNLIDNKITSTVAKSYDDRLTGSSRTVPSKTEDVEQ